MKIWIEGPNRSDLRPMAIGLLLFTGFLFGLALAGFVSYTNHILGG